MWWYVVIGVVIWLLLRGRSATPPTSERWRRKYEKVLRSARWKKLRAEMYRRQRGRCARCGYWFPFGPLVQLHHRLGSYRRLGREQPRDVMLVCVPCHHIEDAWRRQQERKFRSRRGRRALARRRERSRRRSRRLARPRSGAGR